MLQIPSIDHVNQLLYVRVSEYHHTLLKEVLGNKSQMTLKMCHQTDRMRMVNQ